MGWLWLLGVLVGAAGFVFAGRKVLFWQSVVVPVTGSVWQQLAHVSRKQANWELLAWICFVGVLYSAWCFVDEVVV